jgi:glycosyltransferase involved in cell wall biosynthesis
VAGELNTPLVSVVVPTLNSGRFLERCLRSVRAQTYESIEIIVVDNYSEDQTREIAKAWGARVLLKGPERSAQRNFGAENASGEYLFFVDSDMELTPKVVEECVKCVSEGYDAIIIPEITVGEGFWSRVRALERAAYVGNILFEASRFFERKVFEELSGYDKALTGPEDYDLQTRLEKINYRVEHITSHITHHEEDLRLLPYLKKRLYYSRSFKRYAKKHPEKAKRQLGLRRATVYWKALKKNTGLGFALFLLKGTEYAVSKVVSVLTSG